MTPLVWQGPGPPLRHMLSFSFELGVGLCPVYEAAFKYGYSGIQVSAESRGHC